MLSLKTEMEGSYFTLFAPATKMNFVDQGFQKYYRHASWVRRRRQKIHQPLRGWL